MQIVLPGQSISPPISCQIQIHLPLSTPIPKSLFPSVQERLQSKSKDQSLVIERKSGPLMSVPLVLKLSFIHQIGKAWSPVKFKLVLVLCGGKASNVWSLGITILG